MKNLKVRAKMYLILICVSIEILFCIFSSRSGMATIKSQAQSLITRQQHDENFDVDAAVANLNEMTQNIETKMLVIIIMIIVLITIVAFVM